MLRCGAPAEPGQTQQPDCGASLVLRELRSTRGRGQVVGVVDQLVGAGVLGEPKAMTTVLQVMGGNNLVKEAVELHRRMADPNVVACNTL